MDYPKPLIVEPLRLPHKHTFILLHGRGSNGEKFGLVLLETPIASSPSSSQWFNNWKLDPPATDREELQAPGLRETTEYLHTLLHEEIALVPGGARNIVFGGLSQGCAASLTAMLLWEGEKLGAVVGVCGWLPFAERILEQVNGGEGDDGLEDESDPFSRDDEGEGGETASSPAARAVGWLREELGVPCTASLSTPFTFQKIPFFLGHGVQDDRVSVILGRRASECLSSVDSRICWKEYDPLGHWYSGEMLQDMVRFVHKETEWSVE